MQYLNLVRNCNSIPLVNINNRCSVGIRPDVNRTAPDAWTTIRLPSVDYNHITETIVISAIDVVEIYLCRKKISTESWISSTLLLCTKNVLCERPPRLQTSASQAHAQMMYNIPQLEYTNVLLIHNEICVRLRSALTMQINGYTHISHQYKFLELKKRKDKDTSI